MKTEAPSQCVIVICFPLPVCFDDMLPSLYWTPSVGEIEYAVAAIHGSNAMCVVCAREGQKAHQAQRSVLTILLSKVRRMVDRLRKIESLVTRQIALGKLWGPTGRAQRSRV